jgi:hypothetical protein
MSTNRKDHTATLLPNGKVLVAGGSDVNDNPLTTADLFDPSSGTWTTTGSMTTNRALHTATLLPNGLVLVTGGWAASFGPELSSAELYNPATRNWTATASMVNAHKIHTATLLPNGLVLVAGGQSGTGPSSIAIPSAEVYVSDVLVGLIKAVQPLFSSLVIGTNYQLQISTNLSGTFTNYGSTFAATNSTIIYPQYFDVADWNQLFFRLVAP